MNLSIKNVPREIVARLKERAKRHHRSLQGELLALLEETAAPKLSAAQAYERIRDMGLTTASDSTAMAREDRDAR